MGTAGSVQVWAPVRLLAASDLFEIGIVIRRLGADISRKDLITRTLFQDPPVTLATTGQRETLSDMFQVSEDDGYAVAARLETA
jgi:hypothetical protein